MTINTVEPQNSDLPEGVHAPSGVEYLAGLRGLRYLKLPDKLIFGAAAGFSEPVGFVKSSDGRGYYLVRRGSCSCPSYRFKGGECKHMRAVRGELERKARIDERNRQRREVRAKDPKPSTSKGFNQPEEART
jgi:hypothetical protein